MSKANLGSLEFLLWKEVALEAMGLMLVLMEDCVWKMGFRISED